MAKQQPTTRNLFILDTEFFAVSKTSHAHITQDKTNCSHNTDES